MKNTSPVSGTPYALKYSFVIIYLHSVRPHDVSVPPKKAFSMVRGLLFPQRDCAISIRLTSDVLHASTRNPLFSMAFNSRQDDGPTGMSTTNIASNTSAVLTIVNTLSFISCTQGQTASLEPFAYVGGPNDIVEGNAVTFTLPGPYATTWNSILLTQVYATVTLETVEPTVVVWNVRP
jgi:hypothetical protein